ncbi:uncharacterized protein DSM5745_04591 [Aspergillus mulundensis]|uniref:Uncharacterized protein n=1 Tax=Aspergillus mulundensis TaxID=1810919 RepID=A0A3D8S4P9_9EURO|nr:hypothetical protein DSM5745_04591 [Aspergillus mulundensis]RDW81034.1 hypothetical protein DSM5745_04591 [Aspergillus mulundensis]
MPSSASMYVKQPSAFDEKLRQYHRLNPDDDTVSFLQSVYKYLPDDGRVNLVANVLGCNTDTATKQLTNNIDYGLLRPMQAVAGKTPSNFVCQPHPRYNEHK